MSDVLWNLDLVGDVKHLIWGDDPDNPGLVDDLRKLFWGKVSEPPPSPPTTEPAKPVAPLPDSGSEPKAPPPPPPNPVVPPKQLISDGAIDLIVEQEVSSQAAYTKLYQHPTWPEGASGTTIGIGYDCGYVTHAALVADWRGLIPDAMIAALQRSVGVHGSAAAGMARSLRGEVTVPWAAAIGEFKNREVPKWVAIVRAHLPNTELLSPDCLGALVSLAYNRGPSFSLAGDRYLEMRNIHAHMAAKEFSKIPGEFLSQRRLWPSVRGLQTRRVAEANLFTKGLKEAPMVH